MSLSIETQKNINRLNGVAQTLSLQFARRETAIELMKLALLCREHVLLLGPPGTGKSELVSGFARGIQAHLFHYLLTRFTEPAELFGPVDLRAFEEGRYKVSTEGMLPWAQVAFLDEVFQGSSAILNTLLSLIHERVYHNGAVPQAVPLLTLFGASNHLPDDPTLHAFSDRFVLRVEVAPVPDESLEQLLACGWDMELARITQRDAGDDHLITPEQLEQAYRQLPNVKMDGVQTRYQQIIRDLRAQGVLLSDRRLVKGLKLIRAAAMLDGRDVADERDLWPLTHIWSNPDDRSVLDEVVQPIVAEAGGPKRLTHRTLPALVEEFELLESRVHSLQGDGGFTAHLSALGQVRRELLLYHSSETGLLGRVAEVVRLVLDRMTTHG